MLIALIDNRIEAHMVVLKSEKGINITYTKTENISIAIAALLLIG